MTKRILIKLSGESLSDAGHLSLSPTKVHEQAKELVSLLKTTGYQIALVVGGGNLWRGARGAGKELERVASDQIGMMATVMNAIAIKSALASHGVECLHLCAFEIPGVAPLFEPNLAIEAFARGQMVIFSAGTGLPFFSTDTASALRAAQIGAVEILKATQVDGIYDKDPKIDPNAQKLPRLSYKEVMDRKLEVMDSMAFEICSKSQIAIRVFKNEAGCFLKACQDSDFGSIVS